MGHYHIQCEDLETFLKVVVSLMKNGACFESDTINVIKNGVCFESDTSRLTIDLTGGY